MKFEIYSKSGCSFCQKVKDWFNEKEVVFTEVNLDNDELRQEFYNRNNVNSVPQIFIGDKLFGNYDRLLESPERVLLAAGKGGMMNFSPFYKPFIYPWAVELTNQHEDDHWTQKEVDLQDDITDWKSGVLSDVEKDYITNILRLFTLSDIAVGQNYCDQLIPKFKNNEIRNMLTSFVAREGIHQRAYALLNDTLGLPESEYHKFLEFTEMSDKFDYMMSYDNSTYSGLALCIAKSVFNEGVSLFSSFAMLLNFQRFGKMKGMGKIVEWSLIDENLHVKGHSACFKQFCKEHPRIVNDQFKSNIYEMAKKIVQLEDSFIDLAHKMGDMEGLTKEDLKLFIRYTANDRLRQLGMKSIFDVDKNPLTWLNWVVNGVSHTNFFEQRVVDYEVAGAQGNWSEAYEGLTCSKNKDK